MTKATARTQSPASSARDERAIGRLREMEALLLAIEDGELLAATPISAAARDRHEAAVALLAILRRELRATLDELAS